MRTYANLAHVNTLFYEEVNDVFLAFQPLLHPYAKSARLRSLPCLQMQHCYPACATLSHRQRGPHLEGSLGLHGDDAVLPCASARRRQVVLRWQGVCFPWDLSDVGWPGRPVGG